MLDHVVENEVSVVPEDGPSEIVHVGSGAVTETVAESQVRVPPGPVATREMRWLPAANLRPPVDPVQATAP